MKLQGCGTALVTPFHPDGSLDEPALTALVHSQIENGVSLLIPCGTTGEASTLTEAVRPSASSRSPSKSPPAARPSSPAALTTPPPRPSSTRNASQKSPTSPASSPPTPTTTAPTRKASTSTSAPSPKPFPCPSCSTTSPAAPRRTCFPRPFSASPRSPTSSPSRNPAAS